MFDRLPGLPASYYYDEETPRVTHIASVAALLGHRCGVDGDGPTLVGDR